MQTQRGSHRSSQRHIAAEWLENLLPCGIRGFGLLLPLVWITLGASAQKPEFELFSIKPQYLTNHTTTTVHWTGTHFAGVQLTWRGACKVLSYTSTETEIVMQIQSERPLDDQFGYCNLYQRNRFGSNDDWVMVNFTDADQQRIKEANTARELSQMKDEMARAGTKWTIHFADGTSDVFRAGKPDVYNKVQFTDSRGQAVTIIVMEDKDKDVLLEFPNECNRVGHLVNGRVTDGKSYLSCAASGAWSAEAR